MRIFESKLFSVIVFFIFTLALLPLILDRNATDDPTAGNSTMQLIFASAYGIILILCLIRFRQFSFVLSRDIVFILLLTFIFSSVLWSVNPDLAIRKFIALLGSTLVGIYWSYRFKNHDIVRIGFYAFSLIVPLSLIFIYLFPELGIHQNDIQIGVPRGIFPHKNMLGESMMYSGIFSVYFIFVAKTVIGKLWGVLILLLSCALLIMSQSTTALLILSTVLVLIFVVKITLKANRLLLISFFSTLLCALTGLGYIFYRNYDVILSYLGKDPTLTGRTYLWQQVWHAINEKPFIGYGYQSFWGNHPRALLIQEELNWNMRHSHNGLLDILLQVGVIGLFLFLIFFISSFWRSLTNARTNKTLISTLPIVILSIGILYNISESNVFSPNSTYWALFIYSAFCMRTTQTSTVLKEDRLKHRTKTTAIKNTI